MLLLVNAHDEALPFIMPKVATMARWRTLVDTARGLVSPQDGAVDAASTFSLPDRSLILFEGEAA